MHRCPDCGAWPEDCQCDEWIEEEERRISDDFPWIRERVWLRWALEEEKKRKDLLAWVLSERPWLAYGNHPLAQLVGAMKEEV